MFGYLNRLQIKQCLITHRKHMKRRSIVEFDVRRQYSSGKFLKLGNLYERLGLTADVSQDDIKKAYYQLSMEHHPDKNEGCSNSSEKFRSITEAYEILSNVASRAQYDRETPYGKVQRRRPKSNPQASSMFTEKDEELVEKIRIFRQNMRKRAKTTSANDHDEFMFRRANVFDFDAWYRAHFQGDFEQKLRSERASQLAREYRQQMEQIMRGEPIRPPRPFTAKDEPLSDIELQMEEMKKKEFQKDVSSVFLFLALSIIILFIVLCIIEAHTDKSPWVDPYVIKREEEKAKKIVKKE